jgi:hypothetical protein
MIGKDDIRSAEQRRNEQGGGIFDRELENGEMVNRDQKWENVESRGKTKEGWRKKAGE